MKTLKQLFYYSFVILAILCTSCEAEDGMDGVNGEQGIPGQNGADGQDGEDGNANVIGVTVDPFPSWTEGLYLGQQANFVEITEPLLTQEVVNDALVLAYFQLFGNDIWYPMTYAFPFDNGTDEVITYTYELDTITIYALSSNGPVNAAISKTRYFIIPTNEAEGVSGFSSKEDVLQGLHDNGININMYEEVTNYYDLD